MKIRELRPGMRELEVMGEIVSKQKDLRSAYTPHALAILRDDSGSIPLNLWRNQIDQVQVNDRVKIKSGFVRSYKGTPELSTWEEEIEVARRFQSRDLRKAK